MAFVNSLMAVASLALGLSECNGAVLPLTDANYGKENQFKASNWDELAAVKSSERTMAFDQEQSLRLINLLDNMMEEGTGTVQPFAPMIQRAKRSEDQHVEGTVEEQHEAPQSAPSPAPPTSATVEEQHEAHSAPSPAPTTPVTAEEQHETQSALSPAPPAPATAPVAVQPKDIYRPSLFSQYPEEIVELYNKAKQGGAAEAKTQQETGQGENAPQEQTQAVGVGEHGQGEQTHIGNEDEGQRVEDRSSDHVTSGNAGQQQEENGGDGRTGEYNK